MQRELSAKSKNLLTLFCRQQLQVLLLQSLQISLDSLKKKNVNENSLFFCSSVPNLQIQRICSDLHRSNLSLHVKNRITSVHL